MSPVAEEEELINPALARAAQQNPGVEDILADARAHNTGTVKDHTMVLNMGPQHPLRRPARRSFTSRWCR